MEIGQNCKECTATGADTGICWRLAGRVLLVHRVGHNMFRCMGVARLLLLSNNEVFDPTALWERSVPWKTRLKD